MIYPYMDRVSKIVCVCARVPRGASCPLSQVGVNVPLVVRLEGTNVQRGKEILKTSGMTIITADDLDDAAVKAVAALKK